MSKKMLKRTAALSALVALSLSGTVFAADLDINQNTYSIKAGTINGADNVTITTTDTSYYGVFGYTGEHTVGTLTIDSASGGLNLQATSGTTTHLTINADEVSISNQMLSAIYNGDASSGSSVIINADTINIDGSQIAVTGVDKIVELNATEVVANATGTGIVSYGDVTINADDITLATTGTTALQTATGYTNSGVTLNAADQLNVTGKVLNVAGTIDLSGTDTTINGDVVSDAKNGGTTNITSTNNTTINGAISIEGPDLFNNGGDTINIEGKNITIDAGNDWAVAVRGGYGGFTNETAVNIGTADTESVTIKGNDIGLIAQYENANINIYGDKLDLEVSGDDAYGIYTGNNSECYEPTAEVNIYTDQTKVTMTGENSSAVVAFSQSTLNIENGLEASGENAILVRGNSTVNVNQSGEGVVKLDGDIEFNSSGTNKFVAAENTVNVNLTTEDSYLNGKVYVSQSGSSTQTHEDVSSMNLALSNGATWNVTGDSFANTLDVNDGNIVMEGTDKTINVDSLEGEGGTVTTDSLTNQIVVESNTTDSMAIEGTEAFTKEVENTTDLDVEGALNQLAATVATTSGDALGTELALAEGQVLGATTATVGANGVTNIVTQENTSNAGLVDMTALSFMAWRGENDDLNERLGNLRAAKEDHGIWTRMSRAQQSYNSVSNQYSMYQIGYDQKAGDWTIGAAYSYTDGKSWFADGTGENTHNVFSLYGTKMNDNGTFVDLVAKYGNLDYEHTLAGGAGNADYDTDAYSFSAEVGKRITSSNGVWVEPQLQLTYGTIDSVSYMSQNDVYVHQDSADSFVARAGIMVGKPVNKGNVYLKASYLYDFAGEVDSTFTKGGQTANISRDLGGGWWEVGAGANFNLSDATQIYLDFEKAVAGEVDVEWKWNAGVRYSF